MFVVLFVLFGPGRKSVQHRSVVTSSISYGDPSRDKNVIWVPSEKQVLKYLKSYTVKDIVELVSKKEKVPKKVIYNLCIKNKK